MRVAPVIELAEEERKTLTKYSRGRNTPAKVVLPAKLILRAAEGLQNKVIAAELETDPQFVGRWRTRFVEGSSLRLPFAFLMLAKTLDFPEFLHLPPFDFEWSMRRKCELVGGL